MEAINGQMQSASRPLPAKVEARLMELLKMEEFDMGEVNWCRQAYWGARDDWHAILIACHAAAKARAALAHDRCMR